MSDMFPVCIVWKSVSFSWQYNNFIFVLRCAWHHIIIWGYPLWCPSIQNKLQYALYLNGSFCWVHLHSLILNTHSELYVNCVCMHIIYHLCSMIYIPPTHTHMICGTIHYHTVIVDCRIYPSVLPPPIMSVRCSYVNDFMWNICLLCDYDINLSIIIVSTRMMCGTFPSILSWLIVVYYPSLILVCYDLL